MCKILLTKILVRVIFSVFPMYRLEMGKFTKILVKSTQK